MSSGYSPEEMRRFWRAHSKVWRDLDRAQDPEGLTNVCYYGAPLWVNRFVSFCQHTAFDRLLADVGPITGKTVLDVGCGVGRWSRLLSDLGAGVVGIDLQPEALADNSVRFPRCRFVEMSADSLGFRDGAFDMAVAVAVIQHMPTEIQGNALSEIRRVIKPGGYFLLLENIKDRGPAVFSRNAEERTEQARATGFRCERVVRYDFAPLIYALRSLATKWKPSPFADGSAKPEVYAARFRDGGKVEGLLRKAYRLTMRAATMASYPLESALVRLAPRRYAHHAGFLLRAE